MKDQIVESIQNLLEEVRDSDLETKREHTEGAVYEVSCAECGDSLTFKQVLDSDDDILIEVDPCECQCVEED